MKLLIASLAVLGAVSLASAQEMPKAPEDLSKFEVHVVCRDTTNSSPLITVDQYQLFALNEGYWNAKVLVLTIASTGMQFKEELVYSAGRMTGRALVKKNAQSDWEVATKDDYIKLFKENVPAQFFDGEGNFDFDKLSCAPAGKGA